MTPVNRLFDVLVAGGGNAGLCAALEARAAGASVLVLEAAPRSYRGGNSRHTRNLRCMHEAPTEVLTDAYPEEEYLDDLIQVTGGATDPTLARLTIRGSDACTAWMRAQGVRFQPALGGTLQLGRTNAFFLGGGKALINAYYRAAEALGAQVLYEAEVSGLELENGVVHRCDGGARGRRPRGPGQGAGRRGRRLRGQPRLAEGILGRDRRQLPDPRHALQPGPAAAGPARAGRKAGRRPEAVPCGRDRRPGAQVRRRHRHPGRLRLARHRGQSGRPPLLRRGRGLLAQALRDLGPAGRGAAGPDRPRDHRPEGDRPLHAAGLPAAPGGLDPRARGQARTRRGCAR